MDPFDHLRKPKSPPPRHRTGEKFLKGPVPWSWLVLAARAQGRSLHVAFMLWFQAGLAKQRTVKLSLSGMAVMGVSRFAAKRGLEALETAGLVIVDRGPGRCPRVTLLDGPGGEHE